MHGPGGGAARAGADMQHWHALVESTPRFWAILDFGFRLHVTRTKVLNAVKRAGKQLRTLRLDGLRHLNILGWPRLIQVLRTIIPSFPSYRSPSSTR